MLWLKFKKPCFLAFAGSILLSLLWSFYNQPFNSDGALFLYGAKIFLQKGLQDTLHIYAWPFYSICIAYIHTIVGLPLITSAYALQAICKSILAFVFVDILQKIQSPRNVQYAGAFLIVFFTTIMLLSHLIIRDFCFWMLILISFDILVYDLKKQKIMLIIAWYISIFTAMLFREEAILYIFARLVNLLIIKKKILSELIICLLFFFIIISVFYFFPNIKTHVILYTSEKIHTFNPVLMYKHYQYAFTKTFGFDTTSFAKYALIGGVILNTISASISALGLPQSFFLFYAFKKKIFHHIKTQHKLIWTCYIFIAFITQITFLTWHQFTVERYFVLIGIFLLLPTSYALTNYFKEISKKNVKHAFIFFVSIFYILIGSTIYTGLDHSPIIKSSEWINLNFASNIPLYTNETVIDYLTNRFYGLTPAWPGSGYTINVLKATDIIKRMPHHSYGAVSIKNIKEESNLIHQIKKQNIQILKIFSTQHIIKNMKVFIIKKP